MSHGAISDRADSIALHVTLPVSHLPGLTLFVTSPHSSVASVLAASGVWRSGRAHEVLAHGAVDYLKKPFKLEHLDALLNLHLSHAQAASLRN